MDQNRCEPYPFFKISVLGKMMRASQFREVFMDLSSTLSNAAFSSIQCVGTQNRLMPNGLETRLSPPLIGIFPAPKRPDSDPQYLVGRIGRVES
jgi:hypothetical protein